MHVKYSLPLVGFIFYLTICTSNENDGLPKLLVVAFDGFRWDFLNENLTPNLFEIAQRGVWAPEGIKNQFVTTTLPNFYSTVTGLYPENHGIIGEILFDRESDETFDYWNEKDVEMIENSRDSKWFSGVPIWQVNENAGNGRRSGCMRFPLCDAKINNKTLFRYEPVKSGETPETWRRDLDTLITWFVQPENPINLGLLYVGEPDHIQHENDIYSEKVRKIVTEVDYFVDYINRRLESINWTDKINVMFISDHGHVNIYKDFNTIFFDNYIDHTHYRWSGKSIFPKPGIATDYLYQKLKEVRNFHPAFNVKLKNDVPANWHYKNNPRIGPIVVWENLGYSIVSHGETTLKIPNVRGGHGYSNEYKEMWPIYVAYGPAFKKSYRLETNDHLQNLDLFSIMCEILNLDCPINDGSLKRGHLMLENISNAKRMALLNNVVVPYCNFGLIILASSFNIALLLFMRI